MRNNPDDEAETPDRLADWIVNEPLGSGWSASGRSILERVDAYSKERGLSRAAALLELAEMALVAMLAQQTQ
ncbi:MAG: hypothetical protein ACLPJH_16010 [Myxococcaceae bacterium]